MNYIITKLEDFFGRKVCIRSFQAQRGLRKRAQSGEIIMFACVQRVPNNAGTT